MRQHYHDELEAVSTDLVEMSRLVETAMSRATRALLNADLAIAENVISSDAEIDALAMRIEDKCVELVG